MVRTEGGRVVKLEDLANFLTLPGQPSLGPMTSRIVVQFSDGGGSLAEAHTCGLHLVLPTVHSCYNSFKRAMVLSLLGNDGFGQL